MGIGHYFYTPGERVILSALSAFNKQLGAIMSNQEKAAAQQEEILAAVKEADRQVEALFKFIRSQSKDSISGEAAAALLAKGEEIKTALAAITTEDDMEEPPVDPEDPPVDPEEPPVE